jgi:alpha-L-fucosidase
MTSIDNYTLPKEARAMIRWLLFVIATGTAVLAAQTPMPQDPGAPKQAIERWKDARFGLFIHWGPVSLTGKEIGWSRGGERRGRRDTRTGDTPVEIYDALYKKFNPVNYDPNEWVRIAQASGMKYLVFTSKHHDGFSEFDSQLTSYKITSPDSPYRKDIIKQLADACHKGGIMFGLYYSQPDWFHPDYRNGDRHAKYIRFLHGQVRELLTQYGKVDTWFFDGLGGKAEDWDSQALLAMMRGLMPDLIINNRAGIPADYDTPENRIGFFQNGRPWETCATITRQWAYKPGDTMRTIEECIRLLVSCAVGDGNLLLNVGPMPDGRIEARQVARLEEMGNFLKNYGESIYGTRGGPIVAPDEKSRKQDANAGDLSIASGQWWGGTTHKGNAVYVHILRWPTNTIWLPAIERKIIRASSLTGGNAVVKQTEQGIEISVPGEQRHAIDTIVKLELDGAANTIPLKRM